MALPFLVLHGGALWKVVLVGCVALATGAVLLGRKLDASRRARKAMRALDGDRREGVIHGTLGGGRAATLDVDTVTGGSVLLHRDAELWIDTTEGRVPLVGDVRVLAGSRMTVRRHRAPMRTPAPLRERPEANDQVVTAALVEITPGDRVIARGALVRSPSDAPSDYRESTTAYSLHATEVAPIAIAARRPRGAAARLPWLGLAALIGGLAIAGFKVEGAIGDHWRSDCFDDDGVDRDHATQVVLSNTHACVLANTMPDEPSTLDHLLDLLDRTPITSEADLQQHLELARFVGGCQASMQRVKSIAQPERLLAESLRCFEVAEAQRAYLELGRFEAAAKLGPLPDRGAGSLLVLARRWREAAALASRVAAQAERSVDLPPDAQQSVVLHWHCLAELMRWYDGDRGAPDRVRSLAPGDDSACRAELVEMTTGAEQDRLLRRGAGDQSSPFAHLQLGLDQIRALSIERALAGEPALVEESVASLLALGSGQSSMTWGPALWVTAIAPEPGGKASPGTHAFVVNRVATEVYDGDLAAAHRDVDRALAAALYTDHYPQRELAILHALVDLYGPATTTPYDDRPARDPTSLDGELQRYLMSRIYLRHGQPLDSHSRSIEEVAALETAARGDGAALLHELTSRYHSRSVIDVLAVLPRITTARDDIAHALRWGHDDDRMIDYDFPWSTIGYAAERRTLFTLAGDPEEAARWSEIYARYRGAIVDRRALIGLALWDGQ